MKSITRGVVRQDYSRIIRREYHRPEYTELAGHAYDVWSEMEGEAEERVVLRTGSLNFGPQGSIVMKYIESLVANNVPHQIMTPDDVNAPVATIRAHIRDDCGVSA